MGKYRVSVLDSFNQWENVRTEWNDLLKNSSSDSIFLTWEWLSSWAECFLSDNRRLFILAVYDETKLIAAAPWYLRSERLFGFSLKYVEFLGTPEAGSDYLDVVALEGLETRVADAIYDFLMSEAKARWDIVFLRDMRANSFFLLQFTRRIAQDGKYTETSQGSLCPVINLMERNNRDNDLSSLLSPHKRAQFRRHLRLLEQQGKVKHDSLSIYQAPEAVDSFLSFYQEKKEYKDPGLIKFIKAFSLKATETNRITIDTLTVGGTCVGSLLHFLNGTKMLQYSMVTDKDFNRKVSIGDTLIGLVLERTIPQGLKVYDFLKGAEDYKLRWANDANPSINLLFGQRRFASIASMMTRMLRNAGKLFIR